MEGTAAAPPSSNSNPLTPQLDPSHCTFCLQFDPSGAFQEITQRNPKNIVDFQSILNYLIGADPTFYKGNEECVRRGLPILEKNFLPPMCHRCHEMIGELHRLHRLLLSTQRSIQMQVEVIRDKITETCPNPYLQSPRQEFNNRILSSGLSADKSSEICGFIHGLHDAIIFEGKNQVIYPSKPPPPPLPIQKRPAIAATDEQLQNLFVKSYFETSSAPPAATVPVASVTSTKSKRGRKRKAAPALPPKPKPAPSISGLNADIKHEAETPAGWKEAEVEQEMEMNSFQDFLDNDDLANDSDEDLDLKPQIHDPLNSDISSSSSSPASEEEDNEEDEAAAVAASSGSDDEYTPAKAARARARITEKKNRLKGKRRKNRPGPSHLCDLCGKRVLLPEVESHMRSHVGDYATKCLNPECVYYYSCPLKMQNHIRKLKTSRCALALKLPMSYWNMKCALCSGKFETDNRLVFKAHLKSHEEEIKQKRFPCPITGCLKCFALKQSVEIHLFHHDLRPPPSKQECSKCKTEVAVEGMAEHLRESHNISDPAKCKHCAFIFPDKESSIEHLFDHRNEDGIACDICEGDQVQFTHLSELRDHYLKAHKVGERKTFICEHCSLDFESLQGFRTHQARIHSAKAPEPNMDGESASKKKKYPVQTYPCDLCPSSADAEPPTFNSREKLITHKIEVHGADPLKCKLCDKTFTRLGLFNKHKKVCNNVGAVEVDEAKITCTAEGCGKTFKSQKCYRTHLKNSHPAGGEHPFKCEYCGKGFSLNANLREHQDRVHLGIRPFVCETCGESFATSTVFKRHNLIHTGERPHQCPICGQAFRHREVLKHHVKGHETKGDSFKPNGPMKQIRKRVDKSKKD